MCGIIGYIGKREAAPLLLEGLKRLEYRGYDSAGVALVHQNKLTVFRSEGKLSKLENKIGAKTPQGTVGIGHTRWATHGKPSEKNAHPHVSKRVAIVHNGIIENYLELKKLLPQKGRELKSETDSEIVCHLMDAYVAKGENFLSALDQVLKCLEGTYALVIMDLKDPKHLYVAKKASPIVIGFGKDEFFAASDIPAFLAYTNQITFLENDEIAVLSEDGVEFYSKELKKIEKPIKEISWTADMAEKGGYKHFMLKEIMEQPTAIRDTLLGRINKNKNQVHFPEIDKLFKGRFPNFNRFYMVACGTSWHAALAGRYYMEAIAKISVSVDTASEFRYREPLLDKKTLLLVISQSGETADTLACVAMAREHGAKVISICNVIDSSIPRLSHATLYTNAGPEIGVASTKAFTTQLAVLLMLALSFGARKKAIDQVYLKKAIDGLSRLPRVIENLLKEKEKILKIAQKFVNSRDFYFIARGIHFPIALEGALKLKEISYVHAEGYAAGEMKHGPIALLEQNTPVVALAPKDRVCAKMISNIQEVKARGASVFVVASEGDKRFEKQNDEVFYVPDSLWYLTPLLISLPLQLLAYFVADLRGAEVDQPRNLAKSVTVE